MFFLCLDVMTRNPDSQTICIGDKAVMNCGYSETSGDVYLFTPLAYINQTYYGPVPFSWPIPGLPLSWPIPGLLNDSNAMRIIVGPVGEQFVGMTKFQCYYSLIPPLRSVTAVLTVLGECKFKPRGPSLLEILLMTIGNLEI